ncbi:MAG: response regulator transcription factor [Chloroflexi bacterium]|nr:response regulator transcription factor [Chloroflexota bacterium]
MGKIRVLVADDHPAFREGLVRVVAEQGDMEVIAQAGDGEEAVKLAGQLRPDIAVLDVAMPKLNGIEATQSIKTACPNTAVLIVSAYGYGPYVLGAVEAGASGYLLKDARLWELVSAIRSLHAGEKVLDPAVAHQVLDRLPYACGKSKETLPDLHQREMEVLKLTARGLSNKEIATALSISVRTVQAHLVNIFAKFGVKSRTEAVAHALREGWLVIDDLT